MFTFPWAREKRRSTVLHPSLDAFTDTKQKGFGKWKDEWLLVAKLPRQQPSSFILRLASWDVRELLSLLMCKMGCLYGEEIGEECGQRYTFWKHMGASAPPLPEFTGDMITSGSPGPQFFLFVNRGPNPANSVIILLITHAWACGPAPSVAPSCYCHDHCLLIWIIFIFRWKLSEMRKYLD